MLSEYGSSGFGVVLLQTIASAFREVLCNHHSEADAALKDYEAAWMHTRSVPFEFSFTLLEKDVTLASVESMLYILFHIVVDVHYCFIHAAWMLLNDKSAKNRDIQYRAQRLKNLSSDILDQYSDNLHIESLQKAVDTLKFWNFHNVFYASENY